jgi:superoxide dismutase, Cu-Zn family
VKRTAAAAALFLLAACGSAPPLKEQSRAHRASTDEHATAVARLVPKNGSTVRGVISFTQEGDKVAVEGQFFELFPGSHSLYIHQVGNCSSPNAASAGPVWNVAGNTSSQRTGVLPELFAGSEGRAEMATRLRTISVGTGRPNDVIGHSVVVHAAIDPDPKAEFGVHNGWLACGVIRRFEGPDWKNLL